MLLTELVGNIPHHIQLDFRPHPVIVDTEGSLCMLATKLEIAINKIESAIKTHPIGDQELEVYRWK
jgi:hypothetical protein